MKTLMKLVVTGILIVPLMTSAATYQYVAVDGTLRSVNASTPEQALALANAQGARADSGVKLDTGVVGAPHIYEYVSTSGSLRTVMATSVDNALLLATDRMSTSGFLILN